MSPTERALAGAAAYRVALEIEALGWARGQHRHCRNAGTAELVRVCREDVTEARASQRRLLAALGEPWYRRPGWLLGALERSCG